MAKQNILNDSTTWGAEATKIEANFDELYNEKADHGYASIEVAKTLKEVDDNTSVKIENLVVNGDFSIPNSDGWKFNAGSGGVVNSVTDGVLSFTVGNRLAFIYNALPAISGDKYYYAIDVKANSNLVYIGNWQNTLGDAHTGSNQFETLSMVFTIGTTLFSYISVIDDRESGWDAIYITNVRRINLTQTFGTGNEPTKEEFELLLATLGIDYFEGEITIPVQKVMQWQLKLIRKNKNAIIAFGGTII